MHDELDGAYFNQMHCPWRCHTLAVSLPSQTVGICYGANYSRPQKTLCLRRPRQIDCGCGRDVESIVTRPAATEEIIRGAAAIPSCRVGLPVRPPGCRAPFAFANRKTFLGKSLQQRSSSPSFPLLICSGKPGTSPATSPSVSNLLHAVCATFCFCQRLDQFGN